MADTEKTVLNTENDIIKYADKLKPPKGYSLSFAVGTSYSLDLKALGQALIALDKTKEECVDDSSFSLQDAIERLSEKVILFHDSGAVSSNNLDNKILITLDSLVFPVKYPDGAFHPKIWVIRFENDVNPKILKFRVLVLSRNMSFDKCLDLIYSLDGKLDENTDHTTKNSPLCDLLEYLSTILPKDESKVERINDLKESLKHVVFSLSETEAFDDFEFMLTNPKGSSSNDQFVNSGLYTDTFDEMLLMSPFLKNIVVGRFLKNANKIRIITRKDALTELINPIKGESNDVSVYIMNNRFISGNLNAYDIHAKLFVTKKGTEQNLYMGSANATYGAFYNNVEFLIRLHCKNNVIDPLWKDLEKGRLFERFEDFEDISKDPSDEEKEKEAADGLFKKLSRLNATAKAENINNNTCDIMLSIEFTDDFKNNSVGYTITIQPGYGSDSKQLNSAICFSRIELDNLGNLYAVKIYKKGNSTLLKEGMLNIRTIVDENTRHKRNEAVFKSVFKTTSINDYLRRRLKSDSELKIHEKSENGNETDDLYPSLPILDQPYEIMLKYASENRFKECKKYSHLDETSELYDLFEQALEAMKP